MQNLFNENMKQKIGEIEMPNLMPIVIKSDQLQNFKTDNIAYGSTAIPKVMSTRILEQNNWHMEEKISETEIKKSTNIIVIPI